MQATITRYSAQEYLEGEKTAESRNEYRDGEIVPMTGGSVNHNRIKYPCKINYISEQARCLFGRGNQE